MKLFKKNIGKPVVTLVDARGDKNVDETDFIPALQAVPEWYRKAPRRITDASQTYYGFDGEVDNFGIEFQTNTNQIGETFKACLPMFDAMTLGYVVTSGSDMYFDEKTVRFVDNPQVQQTTHHPHELVGYPIPDWCHEKLFKWNLWKQIQLPEGYSALYMTPLHRTDLPFYVLPGIVDNGHPLDVNTPVFIKKGFTGEIPAGTPLVQIIPFRREEWTRADGGWNPIMNSDAVPEFFEFDKNGWPTAGMYKKKVRKAKDFN